MFRPSWQVGPGGVAAGRDITAPVFTGPVTIAAQPPARSSYRYQVERIAPEHLHGREAELTALAAFCAGAGDHSYAWWRAPAWTGKSALMSWFVLHPPPDVDVVSFFVTARFKGQSDRRAFIDVVLLQLAELLEQPIPPYLTDSTRESHLLSLLDQVAAAVRERGRRLILVVDGLDEDRGVIVGPDAYSIAALLPPRPPAGLRIVVSGRPDPPIPGDVPADHPLRDPRVVRPLADSVHARADRLEAERELDRILDGPPAGQELVGLLTAAGGGLSRRDLVELSEHPERTVHRQLSSVTGRAFARRRGFWRIDSSEVYVFGHEELSTTAQSVLRDRLSAYRDRLHAWADGYRDRGWPYDTPEYVLRGYYLMLTEQGDTARLIACGIDRSRHDRMLDVSGGDVATMTEIDVALTALTEQDHPDLLTLTRLVMHHAEITARNAHVPADLPAVWAALGNLSRAEFMARSIVDPESRVTALSAALAAAYRVADGEAVRLLVQQIESVARSVQGYQPVQAVLSVAIPAIAATGDLDRAMSLTGRHARRPDRDAAVADLLAVSPPSGPAAECLASIAAGLAEPAPRAWALAAAATAAAREGRAGPAADLLHRAEATATALPDRNDRVDALSRLALLLTGTARERVTARARAEAEAMPPSPFRDLALTRVADVIARSDLDEAERIAAHIPDTFRNGEARALCLAEICRAAGAAGDVARMRRLFTSIKQSDHVWDVLTAASHTVPAERAGELMALATDMLPDGVPDEDRLSELTVLAHLSARAADRSAGAALAEKVEKLSRTYVDPRLSPSVQLAIARAAAGAGQITVAREVAESIGPDDVRGSALTAVGLAMARDGDLAGATQIEELLRDRHLRRAVRGGIDHALSATAGEAARAGRFREALDTVARIGDRVTRSEATVHVGALATRAGDLAAARAIGARLDDPYRRALVLAAIAHAESGTADPTAGIDELVDTAADDTGADVLLMIRLIAETLRPAGPHASALGERISELITGHGPLERVSKLLLPVVQDIAETVSPALAMSMVRDLPTSHRWRGVRDEALHATVGTALRADGPEAAERLLPDLPAGRDRDEAVADIARAWHRRGGHEAVTAFTGRHPGTETVADRSVEPPADPVRTAVAALREQGWVSALPALASADPQVIATLADDVLAVARPPLERSGAM